MPNMDMAKTAKKMYFCTFKKSGILIKKRYIYPQNCHHQNCPNT